MHQPRFKAFIHRVCLSAPLILAVGCTSLPDAVESDFDFRKDAFTFPNFGTESNASEMNGALAVRMFGREAVCVTGSEPCQIRDEAAAWIDEVNQTLEYGHSEGMAVTALLMSIGTVAPTDFGAPTAAALTPNQKHLGAELAYWAATQKLPQAHVRDQGFAAKDVMPFLATALKPGSGEGWRLLIAIREGNHFKGGHALVPFGYFKGERDGLYILRVYDSNMPQAEQRLTIDTAANTWHYEGSFDAELARTYDGTAENQNLLWFSPVTSRTGIFPAPFAAGATLTVAANRANVMVQGENGVIGFQGSTLIEQGGRLIPAAADCLCKLPNEIVNVQLSPDAGTAAQTITIDGVGFADTGTVNVSGNGVSVKVDNIKTSADAGNDTMKVDGKAVTYNSGSDSNIAMTTSVVQPNGSTTTVSVTVGGVTKSVTVDANDPNGVKVGLDNVPAGTTVQVTVTTTGIDGSTQSTTASATTTGNDAQITVNPSTNTAVVDTTIIFETCINGLKDMDEGDIDCGASCTSKPPAERHGSGTCIDGRTCRLDTDCAVDTGSFCNAGICKQPSCTDGIKNGRESDIDCGLGCALCAPGKACLGDSSCDQGTGEVWCDATNTCTPRVLKTLRTFGLPPFKTLIYDAVFDDTDSPNRLLSNPNSDGGTFDRYLRGDRSLYLSKPRSNAASRDIGCDWQGADSTGTFIWRIADGGVLNVVNLNCRRIAGTLTRESSGSCPTTINGVGLVGDGNQFNYTVFDSAGVESAPRQTTLRGPNGTIDSLVLADGGLSYRLGALTPVAMFERYANNEVQATYRQTCALSDGGSGALPASGEARVQFSCSCETLVADAGIDAGVDAGFDAGIDAGVDAGIDAGQPGLGGVCSTDSDCASSDCSCAPNSGNCPANSGRCGAGRIAFTLPTTNGVAPSGTWTVPAGCTTVFVRGWGAAGGSGTSPGFMPGFPGMPTQSGAGGYVSGTLTAAAGDVFTAWVGNGGDNADSITPNAGIGSYAGTAANGGAGDGMAMSSNGGRGGGLSSVTQTGSTSRTFSVPAGSGGGSVENGVEGGGLGAGTNTSRNGGPAGTGSTSGGGGAGQNGGLGGAFMGEAASPGAYGTLPGGLVAAPAGAGAASNTGNVDYARCASQAGLGQPGAGGPGCFVLRCEYP